MSVKPLALVCSAFLLFSFSPLLWAQSDPPSLSQRIWWRSSHNNLSAEVNRVLGNTPSTATPASSTGPSAKGFSVANTANQWPSVRAKTPAPLPPGMGRPVIDVEARVVPSSAAGAIGRFLRKGVPLLSTGFALYDLGQELGFGLDNSSGSLQVNYFDSSGLVCTSGSCPGYGFEAFPAVPAKYSHADACSALQVYLKANTSGFVYNTGPGGVGYFLTGGQNSQCYIYRNQGGTNADMLYPFYVKQYLPPQQPVLTPSTPEAFEQAIAAKSGWATNSAISRALADAIESGEGVQTQSPIVSGPSTTPGPVTTTTDTVNNTTTTSTTTNNHTYSGDTVTTTSTTTNITINNTTGAVISSTTTTTTPVLPESDKADEDTTFSNTDLPPIPQLYEPKYPEGLVGVWNDKKSQLESAPLVALVDDLMPNVGSGGSCPVWTIPLDFGFFNAGVLDFSVPCFIWDFAKVIIIVSALMLARSLVFGG